MQLIIDIPNSFYSDLKENRIDLGAIGCQLLLDKVKNATPFEECEDAIIYFDTIHNLSQTCDLPYSFVENEIEKIMKALKGLPKEPCDDAISRQNATAQCFQAMELISGEFECELSSEQKSYNAGLRKAIEIIRALPPVKPAEKVGQWINPTTMQCMNEQVFYYCSVCGNYADANKYCPTCGAKMQEVEG